VTDIFIDEEFRTALPEPRPEEVAELERQIRRDGAPRDALVVWPTERGLELVDGHHRLAICRRHGLPFRVEERHFESRDAVLAEIVNTQLARRTSPTRGRNTSLAETTRRVSGKAYGRI
jgi:ParB-like chromosome segregation protein Spo0J